MPLIHVQTFVGSGRDEFFLRVEDVGTVVGDRTHLVVCRARIEQGVRVRNSTTRIARDTHEAAIRGVIAVNLSAAAVAAGAADISFAVLGVLVVVAGEILDRAKQQIAPIGRRLPIRPDVDRVADVQRYVAGSFRVAPVVTANRRDEGRGGGTVS